MLKTIQIYASPIPAELLNKFTRDVLLLNSPEYADYRPWEMAGDEIDDGYMDDLTGLLSLIREVWLWRDMQIDAGARSVAGRWLNGFTSLEAAWKSLRLGWHLEDLSGHQAVLAIGLLKRGRILDDMTKNVVSPTVIQEAFEVMAPLGLNWTIVILCALLEYHYDQESARRMIEEHKRLDDLEATALRGFEAAEQIEVISNNTWPPAAQEAIPVRYHAARARDAMVRALSKARARVPPIKRLDDTARERLLIFRLWQGHKSLFGEPKPTAICNIIQAGGVENPDLDAKTIIKSFKGIPLEFDVRDIMPNARALIKKG
ncbi:MAG: hypothetical protein AB7E12_14115 [Burkholderiaceae bacterium]